MTEESVENELIKELDNNDKLYEDANEKKVFTEENKKKVAQRIKNVYKNKIVKKIISHIPILNIASGIYDTFSGNHDDSNNNKKSNGNISDSNLVNSFETMVDYLSNRISNNISDKIIQQSKLSNSENNNNSITNYSNKGKQDEFESVKEAAEKISEPEEEKGYKST